ncbi:MAG: hypothetical protein ACK2UF_05765 [Candidatus Promineifilaceae bacterium]
MKHLFIIVALLLPIGCWASDKNGKYRETYTADHGSCASFILAKNECNHGNCRDLNTFSDWLMGYITSYNLSTPATFDIVAKTNLKFTILWLDNYCKQNPTKSFPQAVASLMTELYPTRQKERPKDWIEK